jgi:hypothetical protein
MLDGDPGICVHDIAAISAILAGFGFARNWIACKWNVLMGRIKAGLKP